MISFAKSDKNNPPFLPTLSIFLLIGLLQSLIHPQIIFSSEPKAGLKALLSAYPNRLKEATEDFVIWQDGTKMSYDDGKKDKTFEELLSEGDLEDQMSMKYPVGEEVDYSPEENFDPGRVRYAPFFRKMYGNTKEEVKKNLTYIYWMPKTVNKKIAVTKVNDVYLKLIKISEELEKLPDSQKKYVTNIAGTFNWREIAGTGRLSMHSFGIAIDINTKHSNYWRWSKPNKSGKYIYKNRIPLKIVKIFEKHGFIWGGRWYHFDTMHFEYRPELLINPSNSAR